MPEVQTGTQAGETTQIFIQFVMMQQQQAQLALGTHPNPPPGAPKRNLGLARAFIDQLDMIATKTRGNLTPDERNLLESVLASLRSSYASQVEAKAT